jgi:hypothetical protein
LKRLNALPSRIYFRRAKDAFVRSHPVATDHLARLRQLVEQPEL